MSKTVVGVFPSYEQAQKVASGLESQGYSHKDVSVIANDHKGEHADTATGDGSHTASGAGTGAAIGGAAGLALGLVALAIPGIGPVIALGPIAAALTGAGIGAAAGGLIGAMTSMGVPEEDAHHYSGLIKEGQAVVMVSAPDDKAHATATLLEKYGADNVEEEGVENTNRFADTAATTAATTAVPVMADRTEAPVRTAKAETATSAIPVVQEELTVGKQAVNRGGVRVYTTMAEVPVSEQVELREEHVNVQRQPVNRPATEGDFTAFREGTIEVREMAEEAVIGKTARVVEEVTIGKEANTRTETVHDTVRHTEVQIEKMDSDAYQPHYQQNYANKGESFDTYAPGYQYGSQLAGDSRYAGRDWNDVESSARSDWEKRGEGTWDSMKDSIRHGWDKVRGKA